MAAGGFNDGYRCDQCGFDYGAHGPEQLAAVVRGGGPRWRRLVTERSPNVLRRRPEAGTWSALEYGWHR